MSEWWSVVGGIVCCEKKKIWGCLCIVAFEVLNGARGTRAAARAGGWSSIHRA